MKILIGDQLDLFEYSNNLSSNFSTDTGLSLSNVSTRSKIRPHPPISRKVLESCALKLSSLKHRTSQTN